MTSEKAKGDQLSAVLATLGGIGVNPITVYSTGEDTLVVHVQLRDWDDHDKVTQLDQPWHLDVMEASA